jgi:hypothetical protein
MSLSQQTDRRSAGRSIPAPWGWRDWTILALLGLGTALALWWYWGRAPHLLSDTTMAIYRAFEVDRSIGQGVLYPRLAMDFNFTYGAPLLQYRPPLVHYAIPVFHWLGLGWIDAARLTASVELLLAGIGMYVYARWLFGPTDPEEHPESGAGFRDRLPALVSAVAYLFAPYLLLDIQERGAIGEAAALAVLPWLFWAMHRILRAECRRSSGRNDCLWPWLGALFTALLILAHNIIALFAIPIMLLYLCVLAWRGRAWRRLPAALAAIAAGLGLSAFYWMPALLERGYAQIESHMLDMPPEDWLSPVGEWIQFRLAFDYWGSLHFKLALWQAVIAVIAVLAMAISAIIALRKKTRGAGANAHEPVPQGTPGLRYNMALLAGITAAVMLLQLDVSRSFWTLVPLVRFVQFPWRLVGIASFCIALMAGYLFTLRVPRFSPDGGKRRPTGVLSWIAAAVLLAVILYAGTYMLTPQFAPSGDGLSEDAVSLEGLSERGRSLFTIFSDFLPAWVKVDTRNLVISRARPDSSLAPMADVPDITVTGDQPFQLKLQVRSDQPFTLRLHRFFFPGWQVYAAGKAVPTGPGGNAGLVTAELPSGDYPVVAQFGQTPIRRLADIITVIAWLAWIAVGIAIRRARPILAALGVVLALAAALMLVRHGGEWLGDLGAGEASSSPVSTPANFQGEIHLLGYRLPRQTWRPGDDLPLRLYWLAQRTPAADYKVFAHLVKLDDSATVAQSDSFPVLGYSPTTRWEPGEIIIDEQSLHLDQDVAPGKYLLLIGLYHPETVQNLPVSGAGKVLPGDRVVLTEIEVQAK